MRLGFTNNKLSLNNCGKTTPIHMKKKTLFVLLCFFWTLSLLPLVFAQENWIWGTSYNDNGRAVWIQGDYLYTVGDSVVNETNNNGVIIKWDMTGKLEWSRTWTGVDKEDFNSIYGTNGYLYTCGYTTSYGSGEEDLLLVKWDENGNQIWNRTWGNSNNEVGYEIWGINDTIYTSGVTEKDILLIKWDLNGNQIWNTTWGGSSIEITYGGLCGDDESFFLTAVSWQSGNADVILQKWTHNGTLIWSKTWATSDNDYSYDIWSNQNTIFVVAATGERRLKQDIVIIAWDKNGTILWDKKWNMNDFDIGTGIWGDNNSLYISGYSVDWATTSYGGEVSVVIRYNLHGGFEAQYALTESQYASDIVGRENSLFVLGHRGERTSDTDISITELAKNFESNKSKIPGFSLTILSVVSISSILIIMKRLQARSKKHKQA